MAKVRKPVKKLKDLSYRRQPGSKDTYIVSTKRKKSKSRKKR